MFILTPAVLYIFVTYFSIIFARKEIRFRFQIFLNEEIYVICRLRGLYGKKLRPLSSIFKTEVTVNNILNFFFYLTKFFLKEPE